MMNTDPNGYGAAAQDRRIEQLKDERDRYRLLYKQRGKDAADAEDQLAGAVDALREIAKGEGRAGVTAANALADLGVGDPLLDRFGGQSETRGASDEGLLPEDNDGR